MFAVNITEILAGCRNSIKTVVKYFCTEELALSGGQTTPASQKWYKNVTSYLIKDITVTSVIVVLPGWKIWGFIDVHLGRRWNRETVCLVQ